MESLHIIRQLRDSGKFSQALNELEKARVGPSERLQSEILRAELLERTGHYSESRQLAEALLRKTSLADPDRGACELILGRARVACGEVALGLRHLQRAITLASRSQDIRSLCWAQLRLLLVLSDQSGPASATPLLANLRPAVMKSGDPAIMAALHIYLAETEAKRGLIRTARRHLKIANQGLSTFCNLWLEALSENVESAIDTMQSDFGSAITHARRCLRLAEETGAASLRASALGNLGNLAFLAAQFDEATSCLTRAISERKGSDSWTACVDTLARIHLARGRPEDCQPLLDDIDEIVVTENDRARYVYRHTQLTRIRLLADNGKFDEALKHVDLVLGLASRSADNLLRDLAMLAKADTLQECNRIDECIAILQSLIDAITNRPADFFAQYERILGCAIARTGRTEVA
jgi:tetratricopeptide (TPR) repeat protein